MTFGYLVFRPVSILFEEAHDVIDVHFREFIANRIDHHDRPLCLADSHAATMNISRSRQHDLGVNLVWIEQFVDESTAHVSKCVIKVLIEFGKFNCLCKQLYRAFLKCLRVGDCGREDRGEYKFLHRESFQSIRLDKPALGELSSASDRRTTRVVAGLGGLICRLTKASAFCFGTLALGPVRYLFRAVRGGALRGGSRACPAFLFTCLRAHILPRVKAGGQLGSQFLSPSVALLTRPSYPRRGVAAAKSSIGQFVRAPSDGRGLFVGVAV